MRKGAPFDRALTDSYGTDTRKLEYEWREDLTQAASASGRCSRAARCCGRSSSWRIGAAWWKRRKKNKETLARWEMEEAAEERLRALAALPVEDEVLVTNSVPGSVPPGRLHDGQWHTLH